MDIFKNKAFHNWTEDYGIADAILIKAVNEMNTGAFEANLGGNVYKKRISLGNKGKSGGARTILAFKMNDKAFFIYAFAKNIQDNISEKELKALKQLAKVYFSFSNEELNKAIQEGTLFRVEMQNG
ncbi:MULTISPECIES: type II toxin-antitoxin system RelE/ParE family toxin [Legionella]|uniref:type II toxin-antitoxin system RelE/ParE family toxin n=1 Tax=Legionella TaxID=445 RepID=UPI00095F0B5E|nr:MULTISPECIES: type II toxin-antitoxin system RelE/ParE family toxin [Legionella]MBN9226677.1 type II toxin-antitoxin system RelE/ParE family toxin [Legionella steelei]OJW12313.1 MAG: hypothetical protein BGO44_01680 [Legionella sp. 39-23]